MKKRNFVIWCSLAVVALVATGFTVGCSKQKPPATIKIGLLIDMTGPIGPGGIDLEKGARLAFEKIGMTIAGKKVELILEDSASDAGVSLDKVRKLVETDKVAAVIGPINSESSVAQYIEKAHVPELMAMNASDDLNSHDWVFSPVGTNSQSTFRAGIYAADVLHYKTATCMGTDVVPGHSEILGFKEGFESRGGKVIQETYYPIETTNMIPYLTALKKADVFVFWGVPSNVMAVFPQYRELNIKMPVIQPENGAVTGSPGLTEHLGKSAIGIVFGTDYLYTEDNPGNKEFVQDFQAKYHQLPGVMSGTGYADSQVLIAALQADGGDTTPDVLYKALKSVSVDTIRGHLYFPTDQGGYGLVMNFPALMAKIGPNLEVIPILPTPDVHVVYKDGKYTPFIASQQ